MAFFISYWEACGNPVLPKKKPRVKYVGKGKNKEIFFRCNGCGTYVKRIELVDANKCVNCN